jgi:hypothetical protein
MLGGSWGAAQLTAPQEGLSKYYERFSFCDLLLSWGIVWSEVDDASAHGHYLDRGKYVIRTDNDCWGWNYTSAWENFSFSSLVSDWDSSFLSEEIFVRSSGAGDSSGCCPRTRSSENSGLELSVVASVQQWTKFSIGTWISCSSQGPSRRDPRCPVACRHSHCSLSLCGPPSFNLEETRQSIISSSAARNRPVTGLTSGRPWANFSWPLFGQRDMDEHFNHHWQEESLM